MDTQHSMATMMAEMPTQSVLAKDSELPPIQLAISGMTQALTVEIREVVKRPSVSVRLRQGKRRATGGDGTVEYQFSLPRRARVRPDTGVLIRIGEKELEGLITEVEVGQVRIEIGEDIGEFVESVDMVSDESWLLKRAKDRLKQVAADEAGNFNIALAAKAIGLGPANPPDKIPSRPQADMNPEQRQAVEKACAGELTFLWGPPGTGKTQVLSRVAIELYREGHSILLLSNTNRALDALVHRFCEEVSQDKGFASGAVLRMGAIVNENLEKEYGSSISLSSVLDRSLADGRKEMNALAERELDCQKRLLELGFDQEEIALMVKNQEALPRVERDIENFQLEKQRQSERLKQARNQARIGITSPQNLFGLLRNVLPHSSRQDERRLAIESETKELEEWNQRAELKLPLMKAKKEAIAIGVEQTKWKEEMRRRRKDEGMLRQEAIGNCQVLAATIAQSYLSSQIPRRFDVVIVDEASMVPLPLLFWVAGLAGKQVIVAGDFCQLPPIVTSSRRNCLPEEWKLVENYLKRDAFAAVGAEKALSIGKHPWWLSPLSTQYRMAAPICEISNALSYAPAGNPLHTAPEVLQRLTPECSLGKGKIFYVDTGPLKPKIDAGTHRNPTHIRIIQGLLAMLESGGYLSMEAGSRVGVIAPYRDQVDEILLRLEQNESFIDIPVATVHSFQGSEKEMIIMDLVAAEGLKPGYFMRGRLPQDDGTRLINVAVSRAKERLVIIADFSYLRGNGVPPMGAVRTLLDMVLKEGTALDAELLWHMAPEREEAPAFISVQTQEEKEVELEAKEYRDEVDMWEISGDEMPPITDQDFPVFEED